jgi:hypothetical protein
MFRAERKGAQRLQRSLPCTFVRVAWNVPSDATRIDSHQQENRHGLRLGAESLRVNPCVGGALGTILIFLAVHNTALFFFMLS